MAPNCWLVPLPPVLPRYLAGLPHARPVTRSRTALAGRITAQAVDPNQPPQCPCHRRWLAFPQASAPSLLAWTCAVNALTAVHGPVDPANNPRTVERALRAQPWRVRRRWLPTACLVLRIKALRAARFRSSLDLPALAVGNRRSAWDEWLASPEGSPAAQGLTLKLPGECQASRPDRQKNKPTLHELHQSHAESPPEPGSRCPPSICRARTDRGVVVGEWIRLATQLPPYLLFFWGQLRLKSRPDAPVRLEWLDLLYCPPCKRSTYRSLLPGIATVISQAEQLELFSAT